MHLLVPSVSAPNPLSLPDEEDDPLRLPRFLMGDKILADLSSIVSLALERDYFIILGPSSCLKSLTR